MRTSFATAVAASVGLVLAQTAVGQNADKKLGTVHFATSCKPEAQKLFDRGMLYQHSFWYRASQKEFEDVLKADPECGIAYWGVALSVLWNPHVPTPAKNLTDGAAAIAKAKAVGAKTQRERDYVDALSAMYADFDKVDRGARMQNYTKAMEQLAQRYPKDDEAQIHYALALNTSASSADKTYANQLKGAAILEPIAKRQPQHPGVAHYLIHLYDYPAIAAKGIEAARRYAKIAPGAAARAAHAVTYFYARRLLEGVDCVQYRSGARRERSQGFPRAAASNGLRCLCLSAAWAGRQGQGCRRRDDDGDRLYRDVPGRTLCVGCFAGALRDRT